MSMNPSPSMSRGRGEGAVSIRGVSIRVQSPPWLADQQREVSTPRRFRHPDRASIPGTDRSARAVGRSLDTATYTWLSDTPPSRIDICTFSVRSFNCICGSVTFPQVPPPLSVRQISRPSPPPGLVAT